MQVIKASTKSCDWLSKEPEWRQAKICKDWIHSVEYQDLPTASAACPLTCSSCPPTPEPSLKPSMEPSTPKPSPSPKSFTSKDDLEYAVHEYCADEESRWGKYG